MFQDIKKNKLKTGAIISIFIVIITLIVYYILLVQVLWIFGDFYCKYI